jgi:hypothetical protein
MKKIVVLGLVAIMLSMGLVLVSCKDVGCPSGGKCDSPKTMKDVCFYDNGVTPNFEQAEKCAGDSFKNGSTDWKCSC